MGNLIHVFAGFHPTNGVPGYGIDVPVLSTPCETNHRDLRVEPWTSRCLVAVARAHAVCDVLPRNVVASCAMLRQETTAVVSNRWYINRQVY